MRIEKYNAARLREFLKSEDFRTMPVIPVSEHRALSWLQNPRLEEDDVIMYLGYEGEELIAYRCILADRYADVRFGWLSGIWVRPDHRRSGHAGALLEEAFMDWGHQLMYTNYAPQAKRLLDKSGLFSLYRERAGIRYYQRSSATDLLGNRSAVFKISRPLLRVADGILNTFQDIRIRFAEKERGKLMPDLMPQESHNVDSDAMHFLEKSRGTGFCLRMQVDFNWITGYPWIKEGPEKDERYFFSSYAPSFRNAIVKIRNNAGEMSGFLWMVINADKMSLPYAVFNPDAAPAVSHILNHYLQKQKISYLTCYQSEIINIYQPSAILGRRNINQHYHATHDLIKQLPDPESILFQDGDGDVVFV